MQSAVKANNLAFKIKKVWNLRSKLIAARKDSNYSTYVDLSRPRTNHFKKGAAGMEGFKNPTSYFDGTDLIYR